MQFVVKEEKHVDHSSDDDVALLMHYQCDEEGENTSEIGQPSAQYNPQALGFIFLYKSVYTSSFVFAILVFAADQEANRPTGRGSEARAQPEIDVSPPHLSPKSPMLSSDEVDVEDLPYLMPILEEQPLKAGNTVALLTKRARLWLFLFHEFFFQIKNQKSTDQNRQGQSESSFRTAPKRQ